MAGHKGMNDFVFDEDQLAQALKEAAKAERPAFSETLYAQIIDRAAVLQAVQPSRASSISAKVARTLKRVGWIVLATYAALVTIAVLIQFVQKYQMFYRSHSEVSATNASDSSSQGETDDSDLRTNQLGKVAPTESIQHLVSAPDRTVERMEFALSQIDRQRWANLDHDLRLAQQLLQHQLPLGVLSRVETFERNTP